MLAPTPDRPLGPLSPLGKLALAVEILAAYASVRRALRRTDLPRTLELARAPAARAGRRTVETRKDQLLGARLGRAVARTLRLLPTDSRCLMRSLVLTKLLARRGVDCALVIGVSVDPGFAAHAWVERAEVPLLPTDRSEYARLVRL
jgi:Transglutaminase-like superfamily